MSSTNNTTCAEAGKSSAEDLEHVVLVADATLERLDELSEELGYLSVQLQMLGGAIHESDPELAQALIAASEGAELLGSDSSTGKPVRKVMCMMQDLAAKVAA